MEFPSHSSVGRCTCRSIARGIAASTFLVLIEALAGLPAQVSRRDHPLQQGRRGVQRVLELVEQHVRDVVGGDLAEVLAVGAGELHGVRRGADGGDQLQQPHDRRRVEEVHPDDPLGPLGDHGQVDDRERGGVGGQDDLRPGQLVQPAEQAELCLHVLGGRLEDQVGVGHVLEVGGGCDPPEHVVPLPRLQLPAVHRAPHGPIDGRGSPSHPFLVRLHEHGLYAGAGHHLRDAGAHDPGADDPHLPDVLRLHRPSRPARFPTASVVHPRGARPGLERGAPGPLLLALGQPFLSSPRVLGTPAPGSPGTEGWGKHVSDMPRVGDEFAGYRIEAVIGRGGMSVVFRAESIRLGTDVALKILAPELAQDDMFRERFVRESRIAAAINHPNVVTIYDAGSAEGLLYLAMRHIRGRDLKAIIREQGALPLARTVSIMSQVASALDAAHAQKLIHRDIKPANILIYEEGEGSSPYEHVYLTDFGLTKHSESRSGLTKTGQFVGTIDYSPPEQILGQPVTARVDVYSLGCVVYECLTGMPPFRKDQDVATIWAHVQEQAAPVSYIRTELTPGVDAVVARAMAKAPEDRYERCGEFLVDLRKEISAILGMAPSALEDTRGRGQRVASPVIGPTDGPSSAASTRPGEGISIPPMPVPTASAPSGPSRESTAVATGGLGKSASASSGGPTPSGPVLERPPASSRRRGRGALVPLAILAAFALAAGGIVVGRYVVPTGGSAAPRPTGPSEIYSVILKDHLPDPAACHEASSIEPAIRPYLNSPGDVFSTALCRPGH